MKWAYLGDMEDPAAASRLSDLSTMFYLDRKMKHTYQHHPIQHADVMAFVPAQTKI